MRTALSRSACSRTSSSYSSPLVGSAVGVAFGADVGVAVGVLVGADVGSAVGAAVGMLVGAAVGIAVGVLVGDAVGLAVGRGAPDETLISVLLQVATPPQRPPRRAVVGKVRLTPDAWPKRGGGGSPSSDELSERRRQSDEGVKLRRRVTKNRCVK